MLVFQMMVVFAGTCFGEAILFLVNPYSIKTQVVCQIQVHETLHYYMNQLLPVFNHWISIKYERVIHNSL